MKDCNYKVLQENAYFYLYIDNIKVKLVLLVLLGPF